MDKFTPDRRCYTCTWWIPLTKRCTCEESEKNGEVTDQLWSCEKWALDEIAKKIYEFL